MTNTFYREHNSDFFNGKEGITLRTLKNNAGEIIRKGSKVMISKRYGGFEIKSRYKKVWITRVQPKDIELCIT